MERGRRDYKDKGVHYMKSYKNFREEHEQEQFRYKLDKHMECIEAYDEEKSKGKDINKLGKLSIDLALSYIDLEIVRNRYAGKYAKKSDLIIREVLMKREYKEPWAYSRLAGTVLICRCGQELEDTDKYCRECGQRIKEYTDI